MAEPLAMTADAVAALWILGIYATLFVAGVAAAVRLRGTLNMPPSTWSAMGARLRARPVMLLDAAVVLGVLIGVQYAAAVLRGPLGLPLHSAGDLPPAWVMWMNLVIQAGIIFAVATVLRARGVGGAEAFGVHLRRLAPDARRGAALYLAVMPVFIAVTVLWNIVLLLHGYPVAPQMPVRFFLEADTVSRILLAVLAVVGAPVCEELAFRGIALPVLSRWIGVRAALIIVSLAFACIHLHAPAFMPLFFIALAFSLGYIVSGSLAVPIAMHACFNAVNLLALLVAGMGK